MFFTVGTKLKIKKLNKGKPPQIDLFRGEGSCHRPPAARPPPAPMAQKLLPASPDPSPVPGIYKPLAPREKACRGWRLQRPQLSHGQGRALPLGVSGAPTARQAQAAAATEGPKKHS